MAQAVLITGSAKRIGRALSLALAEHGYDIVAHYNISKPEAESLKREVEAMGRKCELLQADLGNAAALPELVARARAAFPTLCVLINNASVFERATFLETSEALFDRQFATNFKAPFFLTQAFAKAVEKGQVINLLDTDIVKTHGSHFAYLLSKKVFADFTHMAARALGPKIRVNAVALGAVMPNDGNPDDHEAKILARIPLDSLPTPDSVVLAVRALLDMPHVTGQIIFADGGQHLV